MPIADGPLDGSGDGRGEWPVGRDDRALSSLFFASATGQVVRAAKIGRGPLLRPSPSRSRFPRRGETQSRIRWKSHAGCDRCLRARGRRNPGCPKPAPHNQGRSTGEEGGPQGGSDVGGGGIPPVARCAGSPHFRAAGPSEGLASHVAVRRNGAFFSMAHRGDEFFRRAARFSQRCGKMQHRRFPHRRRLCGNLFRMDCHVRFQKWASLSRFGVDPGVERGRRHGRLGSGVWFGS